MGNGVSQSEIDDLDSQINSLRRSMPDLGSQRASTQLRLNNAQQGLRNARLELANSQRQHEAEQRAMLEEIRREQALGRQSREELEVRQFFSMIDFVFNEVVHEVRTAQFTRQIHLINEEIENIGREFRESCSDPERHEARHEELFRSFCNQVEHSGPVDKTVKPSVAVVGQSGVGKSSLINALAGGCVTRTGNVDTTKDMCKVHETPFTEYFDVPGCSEERSYANLRSIMAVKQMHLIIIVYVDRIEHVAKLQRFISSCKVPFLVVRNKIDQVRGGQAEKEEAYRVERLQVQPQSRLCYVSASTGEGLTFLKDAANARGLRI